MPSFIRLNDDGGIARHINLDAISSIEASRIKVTHFHDDGNKEQEVRPRLEVKLMGGEEFSITDRDLIDQIVCFVDRSQAFPIPDEAEIDVF